jgi:hypothetical protein
MGEWGRWINAILFNGLIQGRDSSKLSWKSPILPRNLLRGSLLPGSVVGSTIRLEVRSLYMIRIIILVRIIYNANNIRDNRYNARGKPQLANLNADACL